jgi:hypothetical protein
MLQQHNTTFTVISLLDNAYGPGDPQITHDNSRGLLIALDTVKMSAEIITKFPHPNGGYAKDRGNLQILPNGNAWACWTHQALQSEHREDGSVVMQARFKAPISNYRSWKLSWIGQLSRPPDVHAVVVKLRKDVYTIVHMSWNGATELEQWHVYHCDANGSNRRHVATARKTGFETGVWTEGRASHVVVEAVDKGGERIGESQIFPAIPPADDKQTGHSGFQAWLNNAALDPLITFFGGILLCVFIVSIYLGFRSAIKPRGWLRRKQTAYEALPKEEELDNGIYLDRSSIELERQDDGYVLHDVRAGRGSEGSE